MVFDPPVERVLTSYRFLGATAVCCGLAVALSTWVAGDASRGARALAAAIGLAAAVALMLLIAWAVADEAATRTAPAPVPALAPTSDGGDAETPDPVVERPVLARRLDEGRALRDALAPGARDARVDAWVDGVRAALEGCSPGVAGYFNALARRTYGDDRVKLDAHLRRLETIVRDVP